MSELTKKEKAYIVKDQFSYLNSTIYGVGDMTLKNIDNWQKYKFDLPASELKMVISIIKKLQRSKASK